MTRQFADPYRAIIEQFNRRGVRYVVVGMAGINYYANNPRDAFATLDYDVLLEPTLSNAQKALDAVHHLGFTVGTTEGALDPRQLRAMVRNRKTLVATTTDGLMLEMLLQVSGYTFSQLAEDAKTVVVKGVPTRVGQLPKLLKSKQIAGRPKDRQFLKRYALLLEPPPSSKTRRRSIRK